MKALRNEAGLGIIDTLVVVIVISVLIGVALPKYQQTVQQAREVALQVSLASIRKAVQVYVLLKGRPPADIRDLLAERYIFATKDDTIFSGQYLKSLALDQHGYPVDPFGGRFGYDAANGRVYATTTGYATW